MKLPSLPLLKPVLELFFGYCFQNPQHILLKSLVDGKLSSFEDLQSPEE